MTYQPRPYANDDTLGNSKNQIRNNFQIIQDDFAVNHVAFGESGEGKHIFVQLPERDGTTTPYPSTASNEGALYTKEGTNPAETNLYFRGESDGYEYQMTHAYSAQTGTFATSPNGWTFLPGGLILQWGSKTNPSTSGTIIFATSNFTFPNSIIQIQLQLYHNSSGNESATVKGDVPPTTSEFQYRTTASSANTILKWWALGN